VDHSHTVSHANQYAVVKQVAVSVAGFDLYFNLRNKGWGQHYWLNTLVLGQVLPIPEQTLQQMHYPPSRMRSNAQQSGDPQRQTTL
jgi:hypothetical protein